MPCLNSSSKDKEGFGHLSASEQFSSSRSWQSVVQSAAMFEMRKPLLTASLAKPRYIVQSILKIYEQFIGGDMHYINS
jgi:hypothetical protein